MEDGKREELEEFESGCGFIERVTLKPIGRVVAGVELEDLADHEGGEVTDRRTKAAEILAKLPPNDLAAFMALFEVEDEGESNRFAVARYKIRQKLKAFLRTRLGIRKLSDIL